MLMHTVDKLIALLFFAFVWFIPAGTYAQFVVKGIVKDSATNAPIESVTIFLSNTQVGTISNADGRFKLAVPQAGYNMVVSCIGYEMKVYDLSAAYQDSLFTIKLVPVTADLGNVTVQSYDKNGWAKWGALFTAYFIGHSPFSKECHILNPQVIHFISNKTTGEVQVFADESIIVINKALGYQVNYQLEVFNLNLKEYKLYFEGYPFFTELKYTEKQSSKWQKNRADAYDGSLMHFMRAVYANKLEKEGFEVKRVIKLHAVENKPEEYQQTSTEPLTGDSIAYAADSVTAVLAFDGCLNIHYVGRKTPNEYRKEYSIKDNDKMNSQIIIKDLSVPIYIQGNGMFYPPRNIILTSYWAWSERIAMLLPREYKPPVKAQ